MKQELKQTFTSYWEYLPLKTACKLQVFDLIDTGYNNLESLAKQLGANSKSLFFLLESLVYLEALTKEKEGYKLTQKGQLLTEKHPQSLKYACILWGEEHLTAWQNLEKTILTGNPVFEQIYEQPFFDYHKENETSNHIYHKAMYEYARDDYENITDTIDFSQHQALIDVGGGLGALLESVHKKLPQLSLFLFETVNVVQLLPSHYTNIFSAIVGDFFKNIPSIADGIVMSRVIHDWNDEKAILILKNVYNALPKGGKLYLIEIMKETIIDGAWLLNLNMQLICDSHERSSNQYILLLKKVGFIVQKIKKLNTLQSIIICKK